MGSLLSSLREVGAQEQAAVLLARDPADLVALDNLFGVAFLLDRLREAGAQDQVTALLARDPAKSVALGDPVGVIRLLDTLREADAQEQAAALAERAAKHVAVGDPVWRRLPAAQPAGGGHTGPGHASGRSAARRRPVRALPRATEPPRSAPVWPGG